MNFDLTEDQKTIKDTARDLLAGRGAILKARAASDGEGSDDALWNELRELGWAGLAVSEEYGGQGLGVVELAAVVEELGFAVAAVPLLSNTLAGLIIEAAGSDEQKSRWLPAIASGEARGAVGTAELVADAEGADVIVLLDGDGARLVEAASADVTARPVIDSTRPTFRVEASGGEPLAGDVATGRQRATIALGAELLGVAQKALDLSLEYAKDRQQYGRPIGAYQAVSHRITEMLRDAETARSMVYYAAWAADADPELLPRAAKMAGDEASESGLANARAAIQVHGGIGFTWEHDCHLLLKRAQLDSELVRQITVASHLAPVT